MTRHNLNTWRNVYTGTGIAVGPGLAAITPPVRISSDADPAFAFRVRIDNVGANLLDNVERRYYRQPGGPYNPEPDAANTPAGQAFVRGGQGPEDWIEVYAQANAGTTVDVYVDRLTQSIPVSD